MRLRHVVFLTISALNVACTATVTQDSAERDRVDDGITTLPDPCNVYADFSSCCAAGCRMFVASSSDFLCISLEHDCAAGDFACPADHECVVDQTSGDGGCELHYTADEVGVCRPIGE